MENILDGLTLSITGIGVIFVSLGLFILLIRLMIWLFPAQQKEPPEETSSVATAKQSSTASDEEEIVAAITVAVQILNARRNQSRQLGSLLESGRGPWWQANNQEKPVRKW